MKENRRDEGEKEGRRRTGGMKNNRRDEGEQEG